MSIHQIVSYLHARGWTAGFSPNENLKVFVGFGDDSAEDIELVLPVSDDFVDSKEIIASALSLLATFEQVSGEEIAQRIKHHASWKRFAVEWIQEAGFSDVVRRLGPVLGLALSVAIILSIWSRTEDISVPTSSNLLPWVSEVLQILGIVLTVALIAVFALDRGADDKPLATKYLLIAVFAIPALIAISLARPFPPAMVEVLEWHGIIISLLIIAWLPFQYAQKTALRNSSHMVAITLTVLFALGGILIAVWIVLSKR